MTAEIGSSSARDLGKGLSYRKNECIFHIFKSVKLQKHSVSVVVQWWKCEAWTFIYNCIYNRTDSLAPPQALPLHTTKVATNQKTYPTCVRMVMSSPSAQWLQSYHIQPSPNNCLFGCTTEDFHWECDCIVIIVFLLCICVHIWQQVPQLSLKYEPLVVTAALLISFSLQYFNTIAAVSPQINDWYRIIIWRKAWDIWFYLRGRHGIVYKSFHLQKKRQQTFRPSQCYEWSLWGFGV